MEEDLLRRMGIWARLGGEPLFRLPSPPRECRDFLVREDRVPPHTGAPAPGGGRTLFLLVKEGLDTLTALRRLSMRLGVSTRGWGFSGLKDAQALTSQWVTGPSGLVVEVGSRVFFDGGLAISLAHVKAPLARGAHPSNHFALKTGWCGKLRRVFANFFGPQRFGWERPLTHELGLVLLSRGAEGLYEAIRSRGKGRLGWWERSFVERYESSPKRCSLNVSWCLAPRLASLLLESVSAYAFNECLSKLIDDGDRIRVGFDLGYVWGRGDPGRMGVSWSGPGRRHMECVLRLLRKLGVSLKELPREVAGLVPRGRARPLAVEAEGLKGCGYRGEWACFRLMPSAYASSLLWENAVGLMGWLGSPCRRSVFA